MREALMTKRRPPLGMVGMSKLPLDRHGRIVPWFVAWIDGQPDHRIIAADRMTLAIRDRLCWMCGLRVGAYMSFVIGPMCTVNRITAEPPCHAVCAVYAAVVCPFLSTPAMHRRERGKPTDRVDPGGVMLTRNPGVTVVYTTRSYALINEGGVLFQLGEPTDVLWFAHGRPATRAEVLASIESGLPALREVADLQPGALAELDAMTATALALVPVA